MVGVLTVFQFARWLQMNRIEQFPTYNADGWFVVVQSFKQTVFSNFFFAV